MTGEADLLELQPPLKYQGLLLSVLSHTSIHLPIGLETEETRHSETVLADGTCGGYRRPERVPQAVNTSQLRHALEHRALEAQQLPYNLMDLMC